MQDNTTTTTTKQKEEISKNFQFSFLKKTTEKSNYSGKINFLITKRKVEGKKNSCCLGLQSIVTHTTCCNFIHPTTHILQFCDNQCVIISILKTFISTVSNLCYAKQTFLCENDEFSFFFVCVCVYMCVCYQNNLWHLYKHKKKYTKANHK